MRIRGAAGFTLMELMIAVAIVGILAAIALPSYREYVLRGNRAVAKAMLSELTSRQESFRSDRKRYATSLTELGYAADTAFLDREQVMRAADGDQVIYSVTLEDAANLSYTVAATPVNNQTADTRCGKLTLSSTGVRTASGSAADTCWSK